MDLARGGGGAGDSASGRIDARDTGGDAGEHGQGRAARAAEIGVVDEIEHLHAELQAAVAPDGKVALQGNVGGKQIRAGDGVATGVADVAETGEDIVTRVKVSAGGAQFIASECGVVCTATGG